MTYIFLIEQYCIFNLKNTDHFTAPNSSISIPEVTSLYLPTTDHPPLQEKRSTPSSGNCKMSWPITVTAYNRPSPAYTLRLNIHMNTNNKHSYTQSCTHTHTRKSLKHLITTVVSEEAVVLVVAHIPQVVEALGSDLSFALTTGGGLPGDSLPLPEYIKSPHCFHRWWKRSPH